MRKFSSPSLISASSLFEFYAVFSTFMMLIRTAFNDLMPQQLQSFISSKLDFLFSTFQHNNQISLIINQFWDESVREPNQLFSATHSYLPSRITKNYKALRVGKLENHKHLELAVHGSEEVTDEFQGVKFTWRLDDGNPEKNSNGAINYSFILSFNENQREMVLNKYIPHVLGSYEKMNAERRVVKIYERMCYQWNESELSHPATFDTLALNPQLKQEIIDDLDRFLERKERYKKVGKPWKRGYLLYGPPGTGKSSLVAAIANYLKFDVYDLELTSVLSNCDLMRAIKGTTNRSIIVIEDIDCNKEVHTRSNPDADKEGGRFSLSGLLNYMDGLWSSCGEERIIIFTTNHKDRIDPALLRPGRMDMHINLSFLKGKAFRILASNYLGIGEDHRLLEEIEHLLDKTQVTPAVVAEQLLRSDDSDVALEGLVEFLTGMNMDNQVE